MESNALTNIHSKIFSIAALADCIAGWRRDEHKIVFTNGVFDILHVGHVSYLAQARSLGHKLIIGLNSDASVKRLKGDTRPINSQYNRALLLAALTFVDAVVVFEQETPINLIITILPDVLVKGADYTVDTIVGAKEVLANGGTVETITFVEGQSSTALINQMNFS